MCSLIFGLPGASHVSRRFLISNSWRRISIDTNVAAWKKKVAALGLEGELLNNQDNKLCESLNVSGIPFFLIYDKEGKLYKYNAYRPSDMRLKPLLEGLK